MTPQDARQATVQRWAMLAVAAALAIWVGRAWWLARGDLRPTDHTPHRGELTAAIDVNSASEGDLRQLPGVGPKTAGRIVSYRQFRRFEKLEDLLAVKGVGPATLERIRPWVRVGGPDRLYRAEEPATVAWASPEPEGPSTPTRLTREPPHKAATPAGERVNVNTATATELQRLPGIGPVLSGRIVEERDFEKFVSADDLKRVHGIGPKTVAKLRGHIRFGGP